MRIWLKTAFCLVLALVICSLAACGNMSAENAELAKAL